MRARTPAAIPDDTCPSREACSLLSDPFEEAMSRYLEAREKMLRLCSRKGVTMTTEGPFASLAI
jgi:hypothetical protein